MDFESIPAADAVLAGPSCVPFTRQGNQSTWDDTKSNTYFAVLQCVRSQAQRNGSRLKFFAIENVLGMLDKSKDSEASPASETQNYLETELGVEWSIFQWKVPTVQTGLPQIRQRLFLCGRLKRLFHTPRPRCEPADFQFPMIPLVAILDEAVSPSELTPKMASNFEWYKNTHATDPQGSIVVCDLSRAPGKVRAPISYIGLVPTLTTKSEHLFVFEVGSDRFRRWLTPRERLMLQGFAPGPVMSTVDEKKCACAAGNATSLPAMALVIACLSERL